MQYEEGVWVWIGSSSQPQISAYCTDPSTEANCAFTTDYPSGLANPPSEWDKPEAADPTLADDELPRQPEPDCTQSGLVKKDSIWCKYPAPDTSSKAHKRIRSAIDAMRQISDSCATRANLLETLLDSGRIHVYPEKALPIPGTHPPQYTGGFAPLDQVEGAYIGLSDVFTKFAYDKRHRNRPSPSSGESPTWLQQVLAHEADHIFGSRHTSDPQTTTFSQVCGGA